MAKKNNDNDDDDNGDSDYKRELRALQIELVKLQRELIRDNARVLVIGRGENLRRLTRQKNSGVSAVPIDEAADDDHPDS